MADPLGTVAGIACAVLSIWCDDKPAQQPENPGQIEPGFYKTIDPPAAIRKTPKAANLIVPGNVVFNPITVGNKSTSQTIDLANNGELTLVISALEISGSEAFALQGICPTIRSGKTCKVTVAFNPLRAGALSGSLLIGTSTGFQKVNLSGTGVAPKVVAKPAPKPIKITRVTVIKKRPAPKPIQRPDPRIAASIASLDVLINKGPEVFDNSKSQLASISTLPANEDQWHLRDDNYKGDDKQGSFDKNISGYPVERCRIIPTSRMIPLVLDTPINSQICGAVLAHVAVDVYGPDGRVRLLKMGSKVEGSCEPLDDPDASRISVEFTKLTRPDGAVIKLAKAQGADAMGQAGLVGEKFDRVFDKYGPTAIASVIGAAVAFATAPKTNDAGTTSDTPLSAAGQAFNQNIAQIVAEELRNATNRKRRIRVKKGTLLHLKPTNYWYFPNPYQIVEVDREKSRFTYTCNDEAFKSDEGRRQNPKG
jgi:type IV secretory pathway VirB10-like protein